MCRFRPHSLESIPTRVNGDGYMVARYPQHPNCWRCHGKSTGELYYHRLVMENKLYRYLKRSEVIHHQDLDRSNNDPENLELTSGHGEHRQLHRRPPGLRECSWCGEKFEPEYISKFKKYSSRKYCSKVCQLEAKAEQQSKEGVAIQTSRRFSYGDEATGSCLYCGEPTKEKRNKFCSRKCQGKSIRKVERPSKKKLKHLVWEYPTTKIAKHYGVSDNAVTAWCKKYKIKKPPRGYWSKQRRK